ncbi:hypothetical protein CK203_029831 [Vitis vinifera]|uniref:Uncharacterized protein n=1 Tax=Vitis vinifera TaxID=29760 RepID=A0A438IDH6_VITVI|nr:hypothetical protein CK203_029831 [Vitis vinifera]
MSTGIAHLTFRVLHSSSASSLRYPVLIAYSSRSPHRIVPFGRILARTPGWVRAFVFICWLNIHIPCTRELYRRGHICRPPQGVGGLFFYYFFAVFPDGSQVVYFQAADGRLARAEKCG